MSFDYESAYIEKCDEVERLREALERVADYEHIYLTAGHAIEWVAEIARAALSEPSHEEPSK